MIDIAIIRTQWLTFSHAVTRNVCQSHVRYPVEVFSPQLTKLSNLLELMLS